MAKATKKKKASKKKSPIDKAVLVSDRVEIIDVRVIKCKYHQTPMSGKGKRDIIFDVTTKARLEKELNLILVFPTFKMEARLEKSKDSSPNIVIEAEFLLIYEIKNLEGIKKDNIEAFGRINGIYNAWPYWREFVQDTIARMGLPRLTVPVFRLMPSSEANKKKRPPKSAKKTKKKKKTKKS